MCVLISLLRMFSLPAYPNRFDDFSLLRVWNEPIEMKVAEELFEWQKTYRR